MDHLANSTAELGQEGKDWYVGWQGIPMISDLGEKCEPVIAFKSGLWDGWCKTISYCNVSSQMSIFTGMFHPVNLISDLN